MGRSVLVPGLLLLACASLALAAPPSFFNALSASVQGPPVIGIPEDGREVIFDGHPRLAAAVGWISIAAWILWLCVVQQSGEGLSLVFLCIWLMGDATNLLGALWQGLLPTMIILAVYYTLCDVILISQVFYYRRKRAVHPELFLHESLPSETDPLLSSFSAVSPGGAKDDAVRRWRNLVSYIGGVVAVIAIGATAWYLSRDAPAGRVKEVWETKAQVVGWISAFLYLGSRLPQIAKNRETKCQGLSLLMFAFAVAGNTTYVASILLQSLSPQHILINASWLVGSGGTIFLDFIVLGQFFWYAKARKDDRKIFAEDEDEEAGDADDL
ncbi:hypothetical protein RQP46_002577 [Phenoliferia psychrophenolica]